jgi:toxin ParE1/3/4
VSYRIIIRAIADDDIARAAKWYQRQAGLGHDFLASVRMSLDRLQMHPDLGIVVFKRMRRLKMRRFPYGIFYVVDHDCIKILGVIHARRSPSLWQKRLRDNG